MRIRNILKRFAICFLGCSIPFVLVGCQQKSQEISFRDIKSEGELIVLTNAYFEPYEYYKNNEIVGVDISIAKLIAERLGLKLKIKDIIGLRLYTINVNIHHDELNVQAVYRCIYNSTMFILQFQKNVSNKTYIFFGVEYEFAIKIGDSDLKF